VELTQVTHPAHEITRLSTITKHH